MRLLTVASSVCCLLSCSPAPIAPPKAANPERASGLAEPASELPGPAACPRALGLDRRAIADELECLLRQYIQIDTTNPPGNELVAARFLEQVLARDGIPAAIIESAPGRANLIARVKGRARGHALMLMHHMDVVPAVADDWSVPPFEGRVVDGYVWGRGSLDNKGAGVTELLAAAMLARLGIPPERDLVLLALADEESGGAFGARYMTEHVKAAFDDVELILNEGGGVLVLTEGKPPIYSVELAQKAPLWLQLTARGKAGHGSAPSPNTAAAVLSRALGRVASHSMPVIVVPEVQALFAARAKAMPEAARAPFMNLSSALNEPAFRARFMSDPHDAALVQNSVAITMLSGSAKENVISEQASAVLDVRLLPGQDPRAITEELARVMAEPSLSIEPILSWQAHRSSRETPLFAAIERLAEQRHPGAPVSGNVIGGFTDCNAFRAIGKVCYGFLPIEIRLDEIQRIHGKDERVSIDSLSSAVVDLHALLQGLGT
jgi:acetylornithine deacetylase/succinyl-diaminopimelate desuccinylase-like protein